MKMYELEPLGNSVSQNHPVDVSQWEWFCIIGVTVANLLRVDNYRYILQKAMFK